MNIILLGGAGFIGTNLIIELSKREDCLLTVIDESYAYFATLNKLQIKNIVFRESLFSCETDFNELLKEQDIVYHLVSTIVPTTSNQQIPNELVMNIGMTAKILDACVRNKVKKVVFISSGGTVYGKEGKCPLSEDTPTNPINTYGLQKVTIEKLLYLYNYMYKLDYRIIRLANPYGCYQRPNGILGAVTTFVYKALKGDEIIVYGNGTVVRDYIYISDAIRGIINIVDGESSYRTFNVGCGYGTSICKVLDTIQQELNCELHIEYRHARKVDVPINFLDISRYEKQYGKLETIPLPDGIRKTAEFMKKEYHIL